MPRCPLCEDVAQGEDWCARCRACVDCCECDDDLFDADELGEDPEKDDTRRS